MSEEKKAPEQVPEPEGQNEQSKAVTRRQFLIGAGAGLVVGAAGTAGVLIATTPKAAEPVLPQAKPAESAQPGAPSQPAVQTELLRTKSIKLTINGQPFAEEIDVRWTLKDLLREHLQLTGTKTGCNVGTCGFCTVLVNDRNIYSCSVLAASLDGANVVTVEGLAKVDKLHPVQQAFWDNMGFQCAMCTPGFIMSTVALLKRNPSPTIDEIKDGVAGNLCRCGSYPKVFLSIADAAQRMKGA